MKNFTLPKDGGLIEEGLPNGVKHTFERIPAHIYEDEVAATKKAIEEARVIADILKDNPGTEISEAALLYVQSLLSKEIRTIESLEFSDPTELCSTLSQVATTQLKLSTVRTKAVKALDKAACVHLHCVPDQLRS